MPTTSALGFLPASAGVADDQRVGRLRPRAAPPLTQKREAAASRGLLAVLGVPAQQNVGLHPAGSSLPQTRFGPTGPVSEPLTRMPRPTPSDAPPEKPFPSVRLPLSMSASPERNKPNEPLPDAVVDLIEADALLSTSRPIHSLPEKSEEATIAGPLLRSIPFPAFPRALDDVIVGTSPVRYMPFPPFPAAKKDLIEGRSPSTLMPFPLFPAAVDKVIEARVP